MSLLLLKFKAQQRHFRLVSLPPLRLHDLEEMQPSQDQQQQENNELDESSLLVLEPPTEEEIEIVDILNIDLAEKETATRIPSSSSSTSTTDTLLGEVRTHLTSASALPVHRQLVAALPGIRRLHRIVHHLLPKPNRGLWEPQLRLDPFILSYLALLDLNKRSKASLTSNPSQSQQTSP